MGLPFEKDPVITNHLGEFLRANEAHGFPTHVLLNGGVFEAKALQKRILQIVNDWAVGKAPSVSMLAAENLNGAVARGAVVYGLARRGVGERVGGGINQNYLIGVEKRNKKESVRAVPLCVYCRRVRPLPARFSLMSRLLS